LCAGEKTAASSWFLPHRPPSSSCYRGSTCYGEVREEGRKEKIEAEIMKTE